MGQIGPDIYLTVRGSKMSRFYCGRCEVELRCIKTGMKVWHHAHYLRPADMHECPQCGARIANAVEEGQHYDNPPLRDNAHDITVP